MNAKQAEERSGITRRNLRFYEQQGLIHPSRNPDNDYRDYSEEDIEVLKKIRALRMLDVTLEDISALLRKEQSLKQVMERQEEKLRKRQKELDTALHFCRELQVQEPDVTELLRRMDAPEIRRSLFSDWIRDYQAVADAEARKRFSFPADKDLETADQLAEALLAYGKKMDKKIVISHKGMEPEFTMDGIRYTAYRECYYGDPGCPSDIVICEAEDPELLDPAVRKGRGGVMRFLCHWWWVFLLGILEIPYVVRVVEASAVDSLLLRIVICCAPAAVVVIWILVLEKVIYPRKKK